MFFCVINSLIIDILKINKISSLNYINTYNIILDILKLLINN